MAQYNRPPKKKEKGPDEFISFFDRVVRYFLIHRTKFIVLIGAVVLGFIGWGVFLYYQNYQVKEFASLYQKGLESSPGEALKVWDELQSLNPPLNLKDVISMQKGGILASEGKWAEASTSFSQASVSSSNILKYPSQWAKAVSLENGGKYKEAIEEYQKMSDSPDNPFKDYGSLGKARTLSLMGQNEEAKKVLTELLSTETEVAPAVLAAARNKILVLNLSKK